MYVNCVFFFFFADQPKIGVYMLNSGSKKLFIKVSAYLVIFIFVAVIAIRIQIRL